MANFEAMTKSNPRQYAGVWMDKENAIIITQTEDADYGISEKLKAEGHQASGSEHSMNNAQHGDNLKYFKSLAAMLHNYDEILVFGPGKAQEQFKNHLDSDAIFKNKKISLDSGEHLTDPQMTAKVREFFKTHQS